MSSKRKSFDNPLILIGLTLISLAFVLIFSIYFPILKQEVNYATRQMNQIHTYEVEPVDPDFAIVIEKIGANSKIVANVDPFNSYEYQQALTQGVAQARGSALPGQPGSLFLFSHSSADLFQATRYNSVFYLLDKLLPGDKVLIYYQGRKYTYTLTQKILAKAEDINYLTTKSPEKTLTLMTCWPPGTSLKRLIWLGSLDNPT